MQMYSNFERKMHEVWVGNLIPLVFRVGNNQQLEFVLFGDFVLIKPQQL